MTQALKYNEHVLNKTVFSKHLQLRVFNRVLC